MTTAGKRTCDSFDSERPIYTARTPVWYIIIGRFVQALRTTEEAREKTTGLAGLSNSLSRGESRRVFSITG